MGACASGAAEPKFDDVAGAEAKGCVAVPNKPASPQHSDSFATANGVPAAQPGGGGKAVASSTSAVSASSGVLTHSICSSPDPAPAPSTAVVVTAVVATKWVYGEAPATNLHPSRVMPHAALPYLDPEDMVAEEAQLGNGAVGQPHDQMAAGAPFPPNERNRADTARALKLFNANPCPEIDVLLSVINRVMGVSTSVVDLFGGPTGGAAWMCNATLSPTGACPWKHAACPWDLLVPHPTLMVVEDLREDARFAHMPYMDGGLRSYISSPIIASDGHRLGGLCIVDSKVNRMDIGQCRLMNNFAEIVVRELERYADVMQRLKDGEELLVAAYQSSLQPLQRNLASSYDSCIMIVDVSKNFELLYVNHAWEQWSGGLHRDDAVGRPLPELLESVVSNSLGLSWTQISEEAKGGSRFVVPRVRVRGSPSTAAVFDISFRCGALEALDNDTLPVAIPTFVQLSTTLGGLYIGRFHMLHDSAALRTPLETAGKVSPQTITAQQMAVNVIPGLKIGQILGRGGYGTAYLAEWHDTQVVCKVQDHMLTNDGQRANAESEIALGQELIHPHVVRTLAHGTIQLAKRGAAAAALSSQTSSLGQAAAPVALAFDFGYQDDDDDFEWVQDLDGHYSQACSMLHFIDMAEVNRHSRCIAGVGGADPMATQPTGTNSAVQQYINAAAQQYSNTSGGGGADGSMATAALRTASGLGPNSAASVAAGWPSPGAGVSPSSNNGSANPLPRRSAGGTLATLPSLGGSTSADSREAPKSSKGYPLELRVFLVLEFCDQGVLQDAIDRGWLRQTRQCVSGPAPCFVLRTALDIAEAMLYLHSKNIIHGDLTGFNILLKSQASDAKLRGLPEGSAPAQDQYGRWFFAKVADFGTSRRLPTAQEYIRTDSYATVTHMPPEMLKSSSMGLACDVWAFGVLLWSMWTGSRPWAGLSHAEIVAIVSDNTESLHFPADTPPTLAALGMRCMSPSAFDRPTFRYVCKEIRTLLDELWETQKDVVKE